MNIFFDLAREADVDALLGMARAFHVEDGHPLDTRGEAAVVRVAKGEPLARAWIARIGREAVGYVVVTLGYSIEYGGRDGFIDDLYLVPELRGRGLGRKMLAFTLSQAAQLGIGTLHLEVETSNDQATRLYRSAGFEATGRSLMRLRVRAKGPPGVDGC
ncbi:MAG: GNAT family N-acetyltransferase [Alphaproteobacteria bacterium]